MSDEQDSWFQNAFGLNIGGVADRIRSEAEEAAGKVQSVVQRVQGAVEGVLDDVVETVTDVAKKVAGAAGGSGGSGGAGGGAGGGSPKTAGPAGGGTGSFPLSGSVGRGGRNAPGDVKAVQAALGIGVDGDCGSKTIAAIEAFQRTIGQAKPDGRVDAGGQSERALDGGGGAAGGTRLEPSAATDSMTSGAWDLVTSGSRAVGDLAEAGWDAAAGAGAKVVSGAAGAAAGVASAVGADDTAKDLRGIQATAESDSNRFFGDADREFAEAKEEVFGKEPPVPRVSGGDTPPPTERPNPPPGGGPPTDRPPPPTERPDRPPEGGPPTERNPILPLPPSFPFPLGDDVSGAFQGVADAASGIVGGVTDFVSDPIGAVRAMAVQPFFVELEAAEDLITRAADCPTLCKALASMRRAAEKICALAGDSSDECRRAQSKVSESARSVANAGCKCGDTRPPIAVRGSIDEVLPEPDDPETLSQSAQAGDIETALKKANLFNKQADVAALLPKAKVPDGVSLNISIVVSKGLNVSFRVATNPNDPSGARLAALLSGKFAAPMKAALQKAKLTVTDTVTVGWLTF